jgi:hypothetical protein
MSSLLLFASYHISLSFYIFFISFIIFNLISYSSIHLLLLYSIFSLALSPSFFHYLRLLRFISPVMLLSLLSFLVIIGLSIITLSDPFLSFPPLPSPLPCRDAPLPDKLAQAACGSALPPAVRPDGSGTERTIVRVATLEGRKRGNRGTEREDAQAEEEKGMNEE